MTRMAGEYAVIGTRPIRHDGVDKVTGRAVYGTDTRAAGMLHGKVLRSPHEPRAGSRRRARRRDQRRHAGAR